MTTVTTMGEAMVLVDAVDDGPVELGSRLTVRFAGAESNVAIGLSRLGVAAEWISRVSADRFGTIILDALKREGVRVDRCTRDDSRQTGVFFKTRQVGETERRYYRAGSAASALAATDVPPIESEWLHLTGITLGLSPSAATAALEAARSARANGSTVSFDLNYRPSQWSSAEQAREVMGGVLPFADWVLCGLEEGQQIFGIDEAAELAQALRSAGARSAVIRVGTAGAYVAEGESLHLVPIPELVLNIADEIGAGDAFSAGFIWGRLRGLSAVDAATAGHRMAARALAGTGDWETLPYLDEFDAPVSSSAR